MAIDGLGAYVRATLDRCRRVDVATMLAYASMTLTISLIISNGPTVQEYIIALVNSNAAGIYESAHDTDIVSFPSLESWLYNSLYWPFILAGFLITFVSFSKGNVTQIFVYASVSTFVIFSISDVSLLIFFGSLSKGAVFENLTSNLFGGLLLASFIILVISIADQVSAFLNNNQNELRVAKPLIFIVSGVMASSAIYYTFDFFYRPLPARISLVLAYPSHGSLAAEAEDPQPKQEFDGTTVSRPPFSFVPEVASTGMTTWRSPQGRTELKWSAPQNAAIFDVELSVFGGCIDEDALGRLTAPGRTYMFRDVHNLNFWTDHGFFEISIRPTPNSSGIFELSHNRYAFFSTERDPTTGLLSFEQFIDGNKTLTYKNDDEGLSHYSSLMMFDRGTDNSIQVQPKSVYMLVDGTEHKIIIDASEIGHSEEVVKCEGIDAERAIESGRINGSDFANIVGFKFNINKRLGQATYMNKENILTVDGTSGWITLKGIDSEILGEAPRTHAKLIAVGKGVESIDINGAEESVRPTDNYVAYGEFEGSFDNRGNIVLSGVSELLWKNDVRRNTTKWENSDIEQRVFFLSVFGAAILLFLRVLFKTLDSSRKFSL